MQVIDIHRTTESGEEKRHCLSALGKAKDAALLKEAMNFMLDSGEVRGGGGGGNSAAILLTRRGKPSTQASFFFLLSSLL